MLNPRHFLRNSTRYALLQSYLRFWHNVIFYDRIIIHNFPALPPNTPLLIVSNHQNTLMDPLALLFNVGDLQPIFLTRSDIFKNSVARKILTFLKMLPIYRQHDKVESVSLQNEVIFEQCVALLQQKRSLVVFPEGNHGSQYRLRTLKKGTARIALKAEANSDWQLGLHILPCGLHYTNCQDINQTLTLNFGEPILIQNLKNEYETNKPLAISNLTQQIAQKLRPLMLNIEDQSHHDDIVFLADSERTTEPLFSAQQTVENLKKLTAGQYETLMKAIQKKRLLFQKNKTEASFLSKPKVSKIKSITNVLLLILTFPIAAFGFLMNIIPFSLPFLITKKLKDKQFTTSIQFVFYSLVTFPIYYLILYAVFVHYFSTFFTTILVLLIAFTGYFANQWKLKIRW
jgi:1-acyl-sn-glycerol-3-phosphate acyltransferase